MKIRSQLLSGAIQFESKSLRERVLLFTVSSVLLFFAFDALLLTPQKKQIRVWAAQIDAQQEEEKKINRQIAQLSAQLKQRSTSDKKDQLDALLALIAQADALLSEDNGAPLQLTELLRTMVQTTPGLTLMSLKTLPVVPLPPPLVNDKDAATASKLAASTIHQYGVEIAIKGNFLALLPYLDKLHRYPKRLFWSEARIDTFSYPDSTLHLTIRTLSGQKVTPLR